MWQFNNILTEYDQLLKGDASQYTQLINSTRNLDYTKQQADYFLQIKDIDGLKILQANLQYSTYSDTSHYNTLFSGYLSELQNDYNQALNFYQSIELDSLLEIALKRMLVIYSNENDYVNSTNVLEQLATLSSRYKPRLAEVLRLSGQIRKSIDTYTDYLSQYPDDLENMLKLGQLYQNIHVAEAAEWIYSHILEHDPDNVDARTGLLQLDKTA